MRVLKTFEDGLAGKWRSGRFFEEKGRHKQPERGASLIGSAVRKIEEGMHVLARVFTGKANAMNNFSGHAFWAPVSAQISWHRFDNQGKKRKKIQRPGHFDRIAKSIFMIPQDSPRPVFGQPGWRRRMQAQYGWDKEFKAVGAIILFLVLTLAFARAGDDTGLPGDDPKDTGPANSEASTTSSANDVSEMFLPLPRWSSFTKMPPLPEALKPMGKSPTLSKPRPAAMAETKPDGAPPPKPAPKPQAPKPDPDLVAISPFLKWVKDHPDAATQARKEAAADVPPTPATPPGSTEASGDPYWMPPMIDGSGTDNLQGGSATYSRPQR